MTMQQHQEQALVVAPDSERTLQRAASIKLQRTTTKKLGGAMAGQGSSFEEAALGLISGAVFGMISPVIGHPFDRVKTTMQTSAAHHNLVGTISQIYRGEGVRGFYKGFVPPLAASVVFRSLQFSTYSGTYAACSHYRLLNDPIPFTGGLRPSVLLGGLAAACTRAVIETPLEYVKVRLMTGQTATVGGGLVPTLKALAKSPVSTIGQMYQGFTPTLLRTIGLLGSFFVMTDYAVRYIPDVVNTPLLGPFFNGGICATAAWTLAFPFESAKSIIQADTTGKYNKMRSATFVVIRQLYHERGLVKGLYRGFAPGAGRSFVANGISMIVYAGFQDYLRAD